jgi:PBCV-specific basic adaptor domain
MKSKLLKLLAIILVLLSSSVLADTYVNGYFRADGTYVEPYVRKDSNSTNLDNYSTQGNTNPYKGLEGTRARDYSPEAQNYGDGRTINTGPRGGQYYINDTGRKVYVPKR